MHRKRQKRRCRTLHLMRMYIKTDPGKCWQFFILPEFPLWINAVAWLSACARMCMFAPCVYLSTIKMIFLPKKILFSFQDSLQLKIATFFNGILLLHKFHRLQFHIYIYLSSNLCLENSVQKIVFLSFSCWMGTVIFVVTILAHPFWYNYNWNCLYSKKNTESFGTATGIGTGSLENGIFVEFQSKHTFALYCTVQTRIKKKKSLQKYEVALVLIGSIFMVK